MAFLPGSYGGPQFNQQFFDDDGEPLALGSLTFYSTGTVTPKDTFTTSERDIANDNPLDLDAAGRATFFLTSGGYDILLKNEDGDTVRTYLYVEDIALTFFEGLGNTFTEGSKTVSGTYAVLATDNLITADSASAVTVNLPTAAIRSSASAGNGLPLIIKNLGAGAVAITPNGSETIDGETGAYTLPAAADPEFPSVWLLSDGISGWYIAASHGL